MSDHEVFSSLSKDKRKRILDAAVAEFARKGFIGASLNTISSEAGIAKGSIFRYFSDKEGLSAYILNHCLSLIANHFEKTLEETVSSDFSGKIKAILISGAELVRENPEVYMIYLRAMIEGGRDLRGSSLSSFRNKQIRALESIIQRALKNGQLRQDMDKSISAFMLDAVIERWLKACLPYEVAPNGAEAPIRDMEDWIEGIIGVLERGMGPKPPSTCA